MSVKKADHLTDAFKGMREFERDRMINRLVGIPDAIEVGDWTLTEKDGNSRSPKFFTQAKEKEQLTVTYRGKRVRIELRAPSRRALKRYRAEKPWLRNLKSNALRRHPVPTQMIMAVDESFDLDHCKFWIGDVPEGESL